MFIRLAIGLWAHLLLLLQVGRLLLQDSYLLLRLLPVEVDVMNVEQDGVDGLPQGLVHPVDLGQFLRRLVLQQNRKFDFSTTQNLTDVWGHLALAVTFKGHATNFARSVWDVDSADLVGLARVLKVLNNLIRLVCCSISVNYYNVQCTLASLYPRLKVLNNFRRLLCVAQYSLITIIY